MDTRIEGVLGGTGELGPPKFPQLVPRNEAAPRLSQVVEDLHGERLEGDATTGFAEFRRNRIDLEGSQGLGVLGIHRGLRTSQPSECCSGDSRWVITDAAAGNT
jgi:hypothetical protein